jgi:zinc transporter
MPLPAFSYGSDDSGLVWGFLIGEGVGATAVNARDAIDRLRATVPGQFVWLHFNLANAASERWLRAHADLDDDFFEILHQGSRSTRIEIADHALVAVVNDVQHNFSFDSADISTLCTSRPTA